MSLNSTLNKLGRPDKIGPRDRLMDEIRFFKEKGYSGAELKEQVRVTSVFCDELFELGKDEFEKLLDELLPND